MAVMLTEAAVRIVLKGLQDLLNAELVYVEQEAQLGLDLPAVTGWRSYDAGKATPDVTEAEVYEIGDGTFWGVEENEPLWRGGRVPVLSEIPLRAAVNHANRGNADAEGITLRAHQMATRSRLYVAALLRVFRNAPNLGFFDRIVVRPVRYRTALRELSNVENVSIRNAGRAEVDLIARLSEDAVNEMVSGGGALPAAEMEKP